MTPAKPTKPPKSSAAPSTEPPPSRAKPSPVVCAATAVHYPWGEGCDAWKLLAEPGLSVLQERMPPGASEERHFHAATRQFFFVLSGCLLVEVGGRAFRLAPGDGIAVPPGMPHQVSKAAGSPAKSPASNQGANPAHDAHDAHDAQDGTSDDSRAASMVQGPLARSSGALGTTSSADPSNRAYAPEGQDADAAGEEGENGRTGVDVAFLVISQPGNSRADRFPL